MKNEKTTAGTADLSSAASHSEQRTPVLSGLAYKILNHAHLDEKERDEILHPSPLRPVCTAKCMQDFVKRMEEAREKGQKVLIAGDYDCDGIMSTIILYQGLKRYGLETMYYIPDRLKEGYGLSAQTVEKAAKASYDLIITVDNGVSAGSALEKARELGVDVIVTDHHLYEDEPDCTLLVHPMKMGEDFDVLCGAGVAFECVRALGIEEEKFLIYAAVASIADCMPVFKETRSIIQEGLKALNAHHEPHFDPFIRSYPVCETDISFQVAPCINALGRLSDRAKVNTFVRYLESTNPIEIQKYAARVMEINEARKEMTYQVQSQALAEMNPLSAILFAISPNFHEGIIGLAAGRLSSQFDKPAIVGTLNGDVAKFSMRAPEGYHCLEFLQKYDGFLALGGHAQAAGFALPAGKVEDFRSFLIKNASKMVRTKMPAEPMEIEVSDITVENMDSLQAIRPFGTGFKMPAFEIDQPLILKSFDFSQGRHRRFYLDGGINAIHFNQTSTDKLAKQEGIEKLIGSISISTWNGTRKAEFMIDEIVYEI